MEAKELEKCIDEFGTEIYRFCIKLCMDKANAEDLYQQTFLKALESDIKLDWTQNPKALFFSVAHNLWKSDQRKNARRAAIAPCNHLDEESGKELYSDINVEEQVFRQELIRQTNEIIEGMPEKFRIPLILYYLFELPVEQIAQTVKKPPGTIKSRLFKGRSLIKKDWRNQAMENKNYDSKLNELIRTSMELEDTPSPELNKRLKASLYQREAAREKTAAIRSIPLWFVPMLLNLVTFSLLAILALLVIANPYLAKLAAGICVYLGIAGILITAVGVKRTNMKEAITIHVQKRGIFA